MNISDDILYKHAAAARDIWLGTLPQDALIPEHKFSRRFQKKIQKLLAEQRRSPQMSALVRAAKRAAVVVIMIFGITFSSLMTVQAYREKVIQIITEIFEDLTSFRFFSDNSPSDEFSPVSFGYLPAGLKETEREQTMSGFYIHFEDDKGMILDITQTHVTADTQSSLILDTEDAEVENFILQGEEAISTSKEGRQTITFTKDNYIFVIYSNLPMDEVRNVAEQMKIN